MHPTPAQLPDVAPSSGIAQTLMEVITELAAVMVEENAILAAGYPAGLSATSDRKIDLSNEYADLWDEVSADAAELLAADPGFTHRLMAAVTALRGVAAENAVRLEAAMTASRQRVEAVLQALHGESRSGTTCYGADGGVPLAARLTYLGTNYHA